jgi:hypothetical protein
MAVRSAGGVRTDGKLIRAPGSVKQRAPGRDRVVTRRRTRRLQSAETAPTRPSASNRSASRTNSFEPR